MENLLAHSHSILVHFALGLFVTGFVVEIVGILIDHPKTRYAGAVMLIVGGTAGLLTFLTGEYAEHNVEDLLAASGEAALEHHEEWGEWAGYLLFATALTRLGLFRFNVPGVRVFYHALAGVTFLVLLITAHYGGKVTHAGHPHSNFIGGKPAAESHEAGEWDD